jgi:hypothetical protein
MNRCVTNQTLFMGYVQERAMVCSTKMRRFSNY